MDRFFGCIDFLRAEPDCTVIVFADFNMLRLDDRSRVVEDLVRQQTRYVSDNSSRDPFFLELLEGRFFLQIQVDIVPRDLVEC